VRTSRSVQDLVDLSIRKSLTWPFAAPLNVCRCVLVCLIFSGPRLAGLLLMLVGMVLAAPFRLAAALPLQLI
jgi:hypothetical protein